MRKINQKAIRITFKKANKPLRFTALWYKYTCGGEYIVFEDVSHLQITKKVSCFDSITFEKLEPREW